MTLEEGGGGTFVKKIYRFFPLNQTQNVQKKYAWRYTVATNILYFWHGAVNLYTSFPCEVQILAGTTVSIIMFLKAPENQVRLFAPAVFGDQMEL